MDVDIATNSGDFTLVGPVTATAGDGNAPSAIFPTAFGGAARVSVSTPDTITVGAGGIAANGGEGASGSSSGAANIFLGFDPCGGECSISATQVQVDGNLSATAGTGNVALVSIQATNDIALGATGNISTLGNGTLDQAGAPAGIQLNAGNAITSSSTATLSAVRAGTGDVYVDLTAQNGIGTLAQPIRIADDDAVPPTGPVLLAHNTGASGDIAISIAFNGGTVTNNDWTGILNSNPDGGYLFQVENGSLALGGPFLPDGSALFGNQSVAFATPQGSLTLGLGSSVQTFGTGTITLNAAADVLLSDGATLAGSALTLSAGGMTQVTQGTAVIDTTTPFTNTGVLDIAAGATLTTNGKSLVNASGGVLSGGGNLDLGSGTLTNDGIVQPGGATNVGSLTLAGNYTQSSTGTLEVDLASATSYDLLAVSGSATLGGTLNVAFLGGYIPVAGATHAVLNAAGGLSGQFSTINDTSALAAGYGPT
ncbi:MAG: hypothetical protein ACREMU_02775, partial [Gemmatimonadaceae bacterium]